MLDILKPCPFCHRPLSARQIKLRYGVCNTEQCWMHVNGIFVPMETRKQASAWNMRRHSSDGFIAEVHEHRAAALKEICDALAHPPIVDDKVNVDFRRGVRSGWDAAVDAVKAIVRRADGTDDG